MGRGTRIGEWKDICMNGFFKQRSSFTLIELLIACLRRQVTPIRNAKRFIRGKSVSSASFTLIELLIVIGILAILTAAVVLVLNPSELLKQGRDSKRFTDLANIDNAIKLLLTQNEITSLGVASTVYVSLPAANSDCSDIASGLPTLPTGYIYHCASLASLSNINGTGWIPIDFTQTIVQNFSSLPVDPVNTAVSYYIYVPKNTFWELNAKPESLKYNLIGSMDRVSTDGGDNFAWYEVGTDLTLSPWNFEFSAFPTATNNSKKPGWCNYSGYLPSIESDETSSGYASFNGGSSWEIWQENIPFDPNATYKISCRVRQTTDPTVGGKYFYCGFAGVAPDGATLLNTVGVGTYSNQHYCAVSSVALTAGSGWVEFTGYVKGYGSPNGTSGSCPNPASPCKAYQGVQYIRPLIILNYSGGNGIADIDYFRIQKL